MTSSTIGFPLLLFHGHFGGKIIIELRVQVAERKVLQFAFYPGDTEAVGHRRVNIKGFFGNAALLGFRLILQGPHVVQTVGQLDQDHPDIVRHGKQHLAEIFRLALFLGLEMDLADLGDAIDEICHLGAEDRSPALQRL